MSTLLAHWAPGHIEWAAAGAFDVGAVRGAVIGSRVAEHLPTVAMRRGFGVLLIGFAVYFIARQLSS